MFGDLNDCYGKALQDELAEANRLEQELIAASYREAEEHYRFEESAADNVDCGMITNFRLLGDM